jgi:hypothetical protein
MMILLRKMSDKLPACRGLGWELIRVNDKLAACRTFGNAIFIQE